eukprot:SAG31_NODE_40095_length_283_cov_0.842391_1_plen_45_part_10
MSKLLFVAGVSATCSGEDAVMRLEDHMMTACNARGTTCERLERQG